VTDTLYFIRTDKHIGRTNVKVESKLELSKEWFSDCDEAIGFAPLSEVVIY